MDLNAMALTLLWVSFQSLQKHDKKKETIILLIKTHPWSVTLGCQENS